MSQTHGGASASWFWSVSRLKAADRLPPLSPEEVAAFLVERLLVFEPALSVDAVVICTVPRYETENKV
jgi:hypothetical protein